MEPDTEYSFSKPQNIMTVNEAADYMGLSANRIRQFIKQNRLPAIKVGNTYIIAEDAVRYFAEIERPIGRPSTEKDDNDEKQ